MKDTNPELRGGLSYLELLWSLLLSYWLARERLLQNIYQRQIKWGVTKKVWLGKGPGSRGSVLSGAFKAALSDHAGTYLGFFLKKGHCVKINASWARSMA